MTQKPDFTKVRYAKAEKARKLTQAMNLMLEGYTPKHVKDMLNLTYQDMIRVGLITREEFLDRNGKRIGLSPYYVCAVEH